MIAHFVLGAGSRPPRAVRSARAGECARAVLCLHPGAFSPTRKCCAASELEQLPEEDMLGFIAVQEESAADELGIPAVKNVIPCEREKEAVQDDGPYWPDCHVHPHEPGQRVVLGAFVAYHPQVGAQVKPLRLMGFLADAEAYAGANLENDCSHGGNHRKYDDDDHGNGGQRSFAQSGPHTRSDFPNDSGLGTSCGRR
eukprot:60345-Prymnesium_polylepis.1